MLHHTLPPSCQATALFMTNPHSAAAISQSTQWHSLVYARTVSAHSSPAHCHGSLTPVHSRMTASTTVVAVGKSRTGFRTSYRVLVDG